MAISYARSKRCWVFLAGTGRAVSVAQQEDTERTCTGSTHDARRFGCFIHEQLRRSPAILLETRDISRDESNDQAHAEGGGGVEASLAKMQTDRSLTTRCRCCQK